MTRIILAAFALVLIARGEATSQTQQLCSDGPRMSVDSLRATAMRLYPGMTQPEQRTSRAVVALVFDSDCRLLHYGLGQRWASADLTTLRKLVPQAAAYTFALSGTADLLGPTYSLGRERPAPLDDGRPLLVWGIRALSGN